MENASKALIIAGAILLSILIIAMGVYFLNVSQEIIPENPLGDVEIQQFNSKFEDYEGESVNGSKVKTLLTTLRTHNIANQDDKSRRVGLNIDIPDAKVNKDRDNITTSDITTASGKVKAGQTYTVELEFDDNSGLVDMINISEK